MLNRDCKMVNLISKGEHLKKKTIFSLFFSSIRYKKLHKKIIIYQPISNMTLSIILCRIPHI